MIKIFKKKEGSTWIDSIFVGSKRLWVLIVLLMVFSMLSVGSAASNLVFKSSFSATIGRHLAFMLIALIICIIVANSPTKLWRKLSFLMLLGAIILLILTLIIGDTINDGKRWISIMGISFQSSELARGALINYVAYQLSLKDFRSKKTFWRIIISTGIVCLLIFVENISTAILLGSIILLMITISGVHKKYYKRLLVVIFFSFVALYLFVCLTPMSVLKQLPLRLDTAKQRIEAINVFNHADDKESVAIVKKQNIQTSMPKFAIANGGLTGVGPGQSLAKLRLPNANSDFIYTIIIEEYGVVGAMVILFLYIFLMFFIGRVIMSIKLNYPKFLVIGLGMMICIQAMIHILVNVGILPVTGQQLPLISRGGTSYFVTAAYFGVILAASNEAMMQQKAYLEGLIEERGTTGLVSDESVPEIPLTDSMYYDNEEDNDDSKE